MKTKGTPKFTVVGFVVFLSLFFMSSLSSLQAAVSDVSGVAQLFPSHHTYSDSTEESVFLASVKNNSGPVMNTPITVVFVSIDPPEVTLNNADGTNGDGYPYIEYTLTSPLVSGDSTFDKQFRFYNPNRVSFSYDILIYAEIGDVDYCPDDPDKTEPGQCGCGVLDTDADGDGIVDCLSGSFGSQYAYLIPLDSTAEYDPARFSLLTGYVEDIAGSPISGVSATIHRHPEYGTVVTDAFGQFAIPFNGGGVTNVVYKKAGLITMHRKVHTSWNEVISVPTVQMIEEDTESTTIIFDGNPNTVIRHKSSEIDDGLGSRSVTMVFSGDNQANVLDEEGNVIEVLNSITTRATEFPSPESMPAVLPPNSGFTYCAELSVDGKERIRFDKPVITWIDNFLGFDVGGVVPVGSYDRDKGAWLPSENGVVVQLLDTDADDIVDALDATGDGLPDDLDGDGSFSDEVAGLDDPSSYFPDSTFWRVSLSHFTPWDCNWPYGPPVDAIRPNPEGKPSTDEEDDDCKKSISSYCTSRSRVLHEDIPIPGTDMTLHYASNRVPGYRHKITVPASGSTVPASLKNIVVEARVAGQTLTQTLAPSSNQVAELLWDGLDSLENPVVGKSKAYIRIGFVYDGVYREPSEMSRAFAQFGSAVTGVLTRNEITIWKENILEIDNVHDTIAEGWTLSQHHTRFGSATLYKGDGTIIRHAVDIINLFAGGGESTNDGGLAIEDSLGNLSGDIISDASGNIFIIAGDKVRKVDRNGIITTVAGNGRSSGNSCDDCPATETRLLNPIDIAFDVSGDLYIAEYESCRIRKVDESGIITTFAGNGNCGDVADGMSVFGAEINLDYSDIEFDKNGDLYLANPSYIRKIDRNGIISTVAGTGQVLGTDPGEVPYQTGDEGPATEAVLGQMSGFSIGPEGNLYFATGSFAMGGGQYLASRVRKIDKTTGIITTVAGTGIQGYSGDGGLATNARLWSPTDVEVDASGNLYITDYKNSVIRKVDQSGIIDTVVGNGDFGWSGDRGPAVKAKIGYPGDMVFDPEGNLYFAQGQGNRVRKVSLGNNMIVENGLGYVFSIDNKHAKTIDLDTGVALREFSYNDDGQLVSIRDQFSNETTVNRDSSGVPYSITSPDGITTTLTIDSNNHLNYITLEDESFYEFGYTPDGLMTVEYEPGRNRFDHTFDPEDGRMTDAYDEEGGHWNFSRTEDANGESQSNIAAKISVFEWNLTSYSDYTDSTGAYTSVITGPSGAETLYSRSADQLTIEKSLPCRTDLTFELDVDPEYQFTYVKDSTESTPGSLVKTVLREIDYEDTDGDTEPDLITRTVIVNGKTTSVANDTILGEKTLTTPEGRLLTQVYSPTTLLTERIKVPELNDIVYEYYDNGRLKTITDGTETRQTTLTYYPNGFLESVTGTLVPNVSYSYDPIGRVTDIHYPESHSVGFTYDDNGNMSVLKTPSLIDHGFGYNFVNRVDSYQTPISGSYSFDYNRERRLTQINFPSGQQIINIYNKNQLDQIQTPEGNIDFTYACGNQVETISKGQETITYGYDASLVTSITLSGTINQALAYAYNNDFNLDGWTYAGDTEILTYDNDQLLTGVGNYVIARNINTGLPENVSGGNLDQDRIFNGYGELKSVTDSVNSQQTNSWVLTRYDSGLIETKTETVDGLTTNYVYTYDSQGRLETVKQDGILVEEYDYDLNGNINYQYSLPRGLEGRVPIYSDHLITVGSVTYDYDLDGFLTTKTNNSNSSCGEPDPWVTSYDYSSRGELLNVILPDGRNIDYIVDPSGRRIAKEIDGITVEKYLWNDLTRLLAVYDGSDNLIMRFEYADGRMPVAMTTGGDTYYLGYDQVGTLRVVSDASGNVIKQIDYDSFGNVVNDTNPSFSVPFGFAGGLYDTDTGLIRFGYRDYNPDLGRWTAKDPILFAGGDTNLYGYVINNPVNFVDPEGLLRNPFDIKREATQVAAQKFRREKQNHNTPGDAFRHCLASCMNTMENPKFTTDLLGWANEEVGNIIDNQECGEEDMDIHNNAVGSMYGEKANSNLDCQNSCMAGLGNGSLTSTYKKGSTGGYWY
jgi:RHS repeat-associated protein